MDLINAEMEIARFRAFSALKFVKFLLPLDSIFSHIVNLGMLENTRISYRSFESRIIEILESFDMVIRFSLFSLSCKNSKNISGTLFMIRIFSYCINLGMFENTRVENSKAIITIEIKEILIIRFSLFSAV